MNNTGAYIPSRGAPGADVLTYCAANKIGLIPWFLLAAGKLTRLNRFDEPTAAALHESELRGRAAVACLVSHRSQALAHGRRVDQLRR
jgi:aryl-alcohol dehydrogenase-like predicted oxidoreductase